MRHPRHLKRALLAANLGRVLFFDRSGGLHDDNICAGCHAPGAGFGDTHSIAIGVQNNLVVGPDRTGPRNQRRSPSVVNTAFYPSLMWNGRFSAPSGDPFDGALGFLFPAPEGTTAFPPNDPLIKHLLIAQAHIPPTELVDFTMFGRAIAEFEFDRYKFRSSPLRNVALQPAFFHNGAFTRLEDAIRHHLDVPASARHYNAAQAGVDKDLRHRLGPIEPVLARIDPLLATPIRLSDHEFDDLVNFVRDGLLDERSAGAECGTERVVDAAVSGVSAGSELRVGWRNRWDVRRPGCVDARATRFGSGTGANQPYNHRERRAFVQNRPSTTELD